MPVAKTHDQFLADMREKQPEITVLGQYRGSKTGVACRCEKCGHEWSPRPNDLLSGHGCPRCGGSHHKTHDEFVGELSLKFPSLEVVGRYRGDGQRIRVRCKECGHERDAIANSLLRQREGGPNCPVCSGRAKLTQEEFVERLSEANPEIAAVGRYEGANARVEVQCLRCGHRWSPVAASLTHMKSGCPRCHHGSTSTMEQFIYLSLALMLGEDSVLSRDRSLGVELDIYVPELRLAIEPGSWYWHRDKLESDGEKRAVCTRKGIRLLTIYDQCPLGSPPFHQDCLVFERALATESGLTTLKSIVTGLLVDYGLEPDFTERDWAEIERRARSASNRMTTEVFRERLAQVSPSVEALSGYVDSKTRVRCRCKECGHEWSTAASNLLNQGTGCPNCAHRKGRRKTTPAEGSHRLASAQLDREEFSRRLAAVSPRVTTAGEVGGIGDQVACACSECGHTWKATPRALLRGSGCPSCNSAARRKARREKEEARLEKERTLFEADLCLVKPQFRECARISFGSVHETFAGLRTDPPTLTTTS